MTAFATWLATWGFWIAAAGFGLAAVVFAFAGNIAGATTMGVLAALWFVFALGKTRSSRSQ